MLARAVVVNRRRYFAALEQFRGGRLVRRVRAAQQIGLGAADLAQDAADTLDVLGLPVMRRRDDREFALVEAEAVGRPAGDDRRRDERLRRRSQKEGDVDVPNGEPDVAVGGARSAGSDGVDGFNETAPRHRDERRPAR